MASVYDAPDFVRSRRAYALENTFNYGITLLVTDVFLAKILSSLGFSDASVGVISSLFTLAYLVQLFSALVVRKIANARRFATWMHTVGTLLFSAIYLIPFLPVPDAAKQVLAVAFLFSAYAVNYFVYSMIYKWGNSFVDPHHRAEYCAGKEMLSLAVGVALTLAMGWVMDTFALAGNLDGAFLFFAAAALIFSACDLACLLIMKKEYKPSEEPTVRTPLSEVLRGTLGNVNFRRIMLLQILLNTAVYMTTGFMGTYQVNAHELAFSVGAVQLFHLIGNAARFVLSKPIGRYADRTSFARALELAFVLGFLAFGLNVFTTPSTRYLIIVFSILQKASLGGTVANMENITYSYIDVKYFTEAMAIKNGVSGIAAFLASLLGGVLLERIQSAGNTLFGIPVYGQQVLSLISALLFLLGILLLHFVIGRQKVIKQ